MMKDLSDLVVFYAQIQEKLIYIYKNGLKYVEHGNGQLKLLLSQIKQDLQMMKNIGNGG